MNRCSLCKEHASVTVIDVYETHDQQLRRQIFWQILYIHHVNMQQYSVSACLAAIQGQVAKLILLQKMLIQLLVIQKTVEIVTIVYTAQLVCSYWPVMTQIVYSLYTENISMVMIHIFFQSKEKYILEQQALYSYLVVNTFFLHATAVYLYITATSNLTATHVYAWAYCH